VISLRRISAAIDKLNDRIGVTIQWVALIMVIVGAFNAIARYAGTYIGVSLSSNLYLELQWYLFSLIFLLGAAYGLNHDHHVRVDVLYARVGRRARAWIDLIGSVLLLAPFAFVMLWVPGPPWPTAGPFWRRRPILTVFRDIRSRPSSSSRSSCFCSKRSAK
jgi:TRAP-type mannitol/chloroaromatic compound transport system permease small subunit